MTKNILTLALFGCLVIGVPQHSNATEMVEYIDNLSSVTISVTGDVVRVAGANGQTLQVYNLAGVCVYSAKIEGADRQFDVNLPKGCYIIKVGKVVRKVSIR